MSIDVMALQAVPVDQDEPGAPQECCSFTCAWTCSSTCKTN